MANTIWQWFQENEPSTGGVTDKIQRYLTNLGFPGTTNKAMYDWLGALGFTGTLDERIYQFELAYIGSVAPTAASVRREIIAPFSFVSLSSNLADFSPGTGAFTVEGFFRFSTGLLYNPSRIFWGQVNGSLWADIFSPSAGLAAIRFGGFNTSIDATSSSFTEPVADTWYYWVIQRDGANNLSIYWNGTQVFTGVVAANYNVDASPAFAIGCGPTGSAGIYWWNDEFRYTSGVARYSGATISVPTVAFSSSDPNYANVKALLHFDGTNGSTNVLDSVNRHIVSLGSNMQLDTTQFKF